MTDMNTWTALAIGIGLIALALGVYSLIKDLETANNQLIEKQKENQSLKNDAKYLRKENLKMQGALEQCEKRNDLIDFYSKINEVNNETKREGKI